MALTNKTALTGLSVGDYVWCKYTASSGAVGLFSEISLPHTWNFHDKGATVVLSNNNLTAQLQGRSVRSTYYKASGLTYWEVTINSRTSNTTAQVAIGVAGSSTSLNDTSVYSTTMVLLDQWQNSPVGTVYGLALDMDTKKLRVYRNNTQIINTLGIPASGYLTITPNDVSPVVCENNNQIMTLTANFGATAFVYTPPSGYVAFNSTASSQAVIVPVASIAVPDGYFRFICVGEDYYGRKKLIADRNIQHTISWDKLNTSSIATGDGVEIKPSTSLIPAQTGASGNVIGSYLTEPTWYGWLAFDRNINASYGWYANGQSAWIGFDFATAGLPSPICTMYSIQATTYTGYENSAPRTWTFEGWHGSGWTILDTRTLQPTWTSGEVRTFYISNNTAHSKYRVNITATGTGTSIVIKQLYMYDSQNTSVRTFVKLPTGGVISTTNNEWDQIIVNSTLNGNITAGADAVWSWSGLRSWMSGVPTSNSTYRMTRGGSAGVWDYYDPLATTASVSYGFRPLLTVEILKAPPTSSNMAVDDTSITTESVTLTGTISDADEGQQVQYRILINSVQYADWTSLANSPVSINSVITASNFIVGSNTITVEFRDSIGMTGTTWTSSTITKSPIKRTTLNSLTVGDYIECEYTATSGAVGSFANLGSASKSLISASGTATPDGKFNFICVDRKSGKGGLCIADRPVQTSISWDTLNAGKLIEGTTPIRNIVTPDLINNDFYSNGNGISMKMSFSTSISITGLRTTRGSYASTGVTARIYKVSDSSLVAAGTTSVAMPTASVEYYIPFDSTVTLQANTDYMIGFHGNYAPMTTAYSMGYPVTKSWLGCICTAKGCFTGSNGTYPTNDISTSYSGSAVRLEVVTTSMSGIIRSISGGSSYLVTPSTIFPTMTAVGTYSAPYDNPYSLLDGIHTNCLVGAGSFTAGTVATDLIVTMDLRTPTVLTDIKACFSDVGTQYNTKFEVWVSTDNVTYNKYGEFICNTSVPTQYISSTKLLGNVSIQYIQLKNFTVNATYGYAMVTDIIINNSYYATSSTTNNYSGAYPISNEWDRFIVNSTLGDKIIAGDNTVWNWSGSIYSWCCETPNTGIAANTTRIMRGGNNAIYFSANTSSNTSTMGFRPVLEFAEDGTIFY